MSATETQLAIAGALFLRFPGGSPADKYLFDGNYTRYPFFESWDWLNELTSTRQPKENDKATPRPRCKR